MAVYCPVPRPAVAAGLVSRLPAVATTLALSPSSGLTPCWRTVKVRVTGCRATTWSGKSSTVIAAHPPTVAAITGSTSMPGSSSRKARVVIVPSLGPDCPEDFSGAIGSSMPHNAYKVYAPLLPASGGRGLSRPQPAERGRGGERGNQPIHLRLDRGG